MEISVPGLCLNMTPSGAASPSCSLRCLTPFTKSSLTHPKHHSTPFWTPDLAGHTPPVVDNVFPVANAHISKRRRNSMGPCSGERKSLGQRTQKNSNNKNLKGTNSSRQRQKSPGARSVSQHLPRSARLRAPKRGWTETSRGKRETRLQAGVGEGPLQWCSGPVLNPHLTGVEEKANAGLLKPPSCRE